MSKNCTTCRWNTGQDCADPNASWKDAGSSANFECRGWMAKESKSQRRRLAIQAKYIPTDDEWPD